MIFGRPRSPPPLLDLSVAGTLSNQRRIRRHVDDLTTSEVVLYPEGAQVTRSITDVVFEPGTLTELEILGITPTADEHAVRFSGDLAAYIVDFTVELVENTKVVFLDKDDEQDVAISEDDIVPQHIKELKEELCAINDQINVLQEKSRALERETSFVETFCQTPLQELPSEQFMKAIDLYRTVCNHAIEQSQIQKEERRRLEASYQCKHKEFSRAELEHRREVRKKNKEAAKEKADEESRKKEKEVEERHLKEERAKYIPEKVYRVIVKLEKPLSTPADSPTAEKSESSAAESVGNETVTANELLLTYNTSDAYWVPSYDVTLDTTASTGLLTYTAELSNKTSEIWADCQIVLSTSEVTLQSLHQRPPTLASWRIQLAGGKRTSDVELCRLSQAEQRATIFHGRAQGSRQRGSNDHLFYGRGSTGLFGHLPLPQARHDPQAVQHASVPPPPPPMPAASAPPAPSLFQTQMQDAPMYDQDASSDIQLLSVDSVRGSRPPPPPGAFGGFGSHNQAAQAPRAAAAPAPPPPPGAARPNAPQAYNAGPSLFGQSNQRMNQASGFSTSSFGQSNANTSSAFNGQQLNNSSDSSMFGQPQNTLNTGALFALKQKRAANPVAADMANADIDWSDHGLTTTYTLPPSRTLAPSSLSTRHKLATTHLTNIKTTHLVIPKLNRAAFLRAHIPLPSTTPRVFEGAMAGITIDSAFLGRVALPSTKTEGARSRKYIELNLGVDPGVQVHYATPTAKEVRAGLGFSSLLGTGDKTTVYSRCTTVKNNKGAAIEVKVLDQVPVSANQEKLRVNVVEPNGIQDGDGEDGGSMPAGEEARVDEVDDEETSDDERDGDKGAWGSASVKMNEDGEMEWEIELEAGKACKLPLRYEVTVPKGEVATSIS